MATLGYSASSAVESHQARAFRAVFLVFDVIICFVQIPVLGSQQWMWVCTQAVALAWTAATVALFCKVKYRHAVAALTLLLATVPGFLTLAFHLSVAARDGIDSYGTPGGFWLGLAFGIGMLMPSALLGAMLIAMAPWRGPSALLAGADPDTAGPSSEATAEK